MIFLFIFGRQIQSKNFVQTRVGMTVLSINLESKSIIDISKHCLMKSSFNCMGLAKIMEYFVIYKVLDLYALKDDIAWILSYYVCEFHKCIQNTIL